MNKHTLNVEVDQPPYTLKSTQEWFASIITNRLGENDIIQPYTLSGSLVAEEAGSYITPSPHLRPHQRIQIYNQQYWWRLLNTLHANFPLVTRLFGYLAFNEKIGIPYLLQFPPNHWSLNVLGERLPKWILEYYKEPDQSLIYHAASLDWAFAASFVAPQHPVLDLVHLTQEKPEDILSLSFYLQPHISLFTWEYDLFTFRGCFLKEDVDYWIEHRFPDLPKGKNFYFILYRNAKNYLTWREISQSEFMLLERFKIGTTIKDACEYIETQEAAIYEQVATHLQQWLQEWTQAGWLTLTSNQE